ncbi:hypothetical protein NLG97_g9132 [Lecanicillium saksenae]|uniref:Uncharacterized protein n=1 Tax=Lecanicillium saksenae TaxID=468837 RepID=A0ACC1QGW7_9HYPO|nr:hypothetical protein NLG97_g9132 [Lecanicillium saksenae]
MRESKFRGRLLRAGDDLGLSGIWTKYYQYLVKHLRITNASLRGEEYEGSSFQAHLIGCHAYVLHIGGAKKALSSSEPDIFFRQLVCTSMASDTTSPVTQQTLVHNYYTDDELKLILQGWTIDAPLAIELNITRMHLTRLRCQAAAKEVTGGILQHRARELLNAVESFCPDAWGEKMRVYDNFGKAFANADIGRLFQQAVRLYAILTLPPATVVAVLWPDTPASVHEESEMYKILRIRHRDELLKLVKQSWSKIDRGACSWVLAVLGCALVDGASEEQDFIAQELFHIWRKPLSDSTHIIILMKLRAFWQSGKTGWDDCWDEPVAC